MAISDPQSVIDILDGGGDYDHDNAPSLTPYITAAGVLRARLVECAEDDDVTIPSATLDTIEQWLAAWAYMQSSQQLSETAAGRAKDKYRGKDGMYLNSNLYGQTAIMLDPSGCLASMSEAQVATGWTGRTLTGDQTTFEESQGLNG